MKLYLRVFKPQTLAAIGFMAGTMSSLPDTFRWPCPDESCEELASCNRMIFSVIGNNLLFM
jgi:hypothetical protein